MPKYEVTFEISTTVEAENDDEAYEIALEKGVMEMEWKFIDSKEVK